MPQRLPDTDARRAPENLAILLREPFLAINDRLMRRLAEHGHAEVRAPHRFVFEFLDDEGTQVSTLAERAGISKQAMAELVAHLERHGYVERVPDPADGRAKLVRTTDRGRDVFAIARGLVADIQSELERRMGKAEVARLRGLLQDLGTVLEHPEIEVLDA
jgi:DNA-binding MarR family transcriptional regulator